MLRRQCSSTSWRRFLSIKNAKRRPTTNTMSGHWTSHYNHPCSFSTSTSISSQRFIKNGGRNVVKEPISEAQRRSAQLELEQMTQSTARLLAITDSSLITDAIVNETRVALHYWSRRWYMHFHPGFGRAAKGSALSLEAVRNSSFGPPHDQHAFAMNGQENDSSLVAQKSGDYGARQAEVLLDWSITHNLVHREVFNMEGIYSPLDFDLKEDLESSPNMTFAQLIDAYLLPCAYNGVGRFGNYSNEDQINLLVNDDNQRHYATLSKHYTKHTNYINAVVDATRIMKKMRELHASFPDHIAPDTLSIKSELNVWSKRSLTLGADHIGVQTGGILAGNIFAGHLDKINLIERFKSLEQDDAFNDKFYTQEGCLREMESILSRAEELYTTSGDDTIKPSVAWYNHILGSWARSDLDEAPAKSLEMLRGMEAFEGVQGHINTNIRACWARPDIISYNSVLFCLARDATEDRAKQALRLFEEMNNRYDQSKDSYTKPDEVTYGSVLHALAQVGMAREAEHILETMDVAPSLTIYNTVLNAWSNSFERNAPRRAELLLERMKSLAEENPDIEPDTVSISTLIACHARSKKRDSAERAEELLDRAIDSFLGGNARMKPDSIMFNCAILAWAHCISSVHDRDKLGRVLIPAERAEMILQKLLEMSKSNTLEIAPMAQTYNLVLDSWAKSDRKDAADRALRLMREMHNAGISPDDCSYNSVLNAMAKHKDSESLTKAEALFEEMRDCEQSGTLTISEMTYNVMMNVYGKSSHKDGAKKAKGLLSVMESNGIQPTNVSYNSCIDAFARRGDVAEAESLIDEMIKLAEQGKEDLRPTIRSYASLVNAIANSGAPDAIDRAEEIVSKVEKMEHIKPNTVLYNSLIHTIVRSGYRDSSARADQVLKRMERVRKSGRSDVKPDSFAYSMVLTICARSNEPNAAITASNILDNMEYLYSQGHTEVVANSRCYSSVITAWARSGSPDAVKEALNLLDRMERNRRNGSPHGTPSTYCYNSVIHAIAKSTNTDKVKHCSDILQRMEAAVKAGYSDLAPTIVTYSTIMNACAFTRGTKEQQKKAFDLARFCLQTILASSEMEPDESIFANFFLVMCRHLGAGEARDRFAEAIFKEACKIGVVEPKLLYHFRNASPSAAKKLLPPNDNIPYEWRRAVRHKS